MIDRIKEKINEIKDIGLIQYVKDKIPIQRKKNEITYDVTVVETAEEPVVMEYQETPTTTESYTVSSYSVVGNVNKRVRRGI